MTRHLIFPLLSDYVKFHLKKKEKRALLTQVLNEIALTSIFVFISYNHFL
jgi:hypothetical protein